MDDDSVRNLESGTEETLPLGRTVAYTRGHILATDFNILTSTPHGKA